MELLTGANLGKESFKVVHCHLASLIYMQITSCKIAKRYVNNLRYADYNTLMAESEEELKNFLMKMKEGSEKYGLKLNIQKMNIMVSSPIQPVQFSHSVVPCSLQPHGLQLTRAPCPSPTPRASSNSCPSRWWCHPSSVVPFSSYPQSFPATGSFPVSQFFTSGGQSTGVSASPSDLPMNIKDWFPLGWTGWISLQSKGLSGVFPNTTVQKHQFFSS